MASRFALITICLVCFNEEMVRATVNWVDGTCKISIPEATTGKVLFEFTGPGGTNTDYKYTIKTEDVFTIGNNGVLSSAINLEIESDDNPYTVDIIATHTNSTVNTVTCEILVTRLEFVQSQYSVDTVDNVAEGTDVLTVSATYGDVSAESNKVEYSIIDATDDNFEIDTETGLISAKKILTAEDPPTLTLTVIATDTIVATSKVEAIVNVCVGCKTSGSSSPGMSLFASMALVFSVFLM